MGTAAARRTAELGPILVVVDATLDIHVTKGLAQLLLHPALNSGHGMQPVGREMGLRGLEPQEVRHIIRYD